MKILTIGGATQDITFHSEQGELINNQQDLIQQKLLGFEFGAKINIKQADFTFGGGAANTAVSFIKLGNQVSSLMCVSNDMIGKEIVNNLKEHKVKTDLIQYSNKQSGLSFVINAKRLRQEHVLFTYRGANEDLDLTRLRPSIPNRPLGLLDYGGQVFDLIYLSSLSGRKSKVNLTKVFRHKQKYKKTKLAWNPGNEQIKLGLSALKTYLKDTDIFIVNKDEAIEICMNSVEGVNLNNIRNLLKILSKYCPGVIVITHGRNGAYAWHEMDDYFQASIQVKEKDTTGVGDAFASTFSWALLYTNYNIKQALELAIKNACAVLKEVGAQNGLLFKNKLLSGLK